MSSEAWVICRHEPSLPPEGEFDDGQVPYTVQPTSQAGARVLSQYAPQLPAAEFPWMVIFEFARDWFDRFEAGGTALARRCGGGVLWSPQWEGRGGEAIIVAARPDPTVGGRWTLADALETAFSQETDWDEGDWRAEIGDD